MLLHSDLDISFGFLFLHCHSLGKDQNRYRQNLYHSPMTSDKNKSIFDFDSNPKINETYSLTNIVSFIPSKAYYFCQPFSVSLYYGDSYP